jgi:hypothetical protein
MLQDGHKLDCIVAILLYMRYNVISKVLVAITNKLIYLKRKFYNYKKSC